MPLAETPDIGAYFERIGYAGSLAPTPETLAALLKAQVGAIPFETLDTLLGVPPRPEFANLQQKLVFDRRGGSGIELNLLLAGILADLDQPVLLHWADVMAEMGDAAIPEGRHLVLTALVGGITYLLDAGFGALTPGMPVRLRAGLEQEAPLGKVRVSGGDPHVVLELDQGEGFAPLYRFHPGEAAGEVRVEDMVLPPGLRAARVLPDGTRLALQGTALETRKPGEDPVRETIASPDALKDLLRTRFGLKLPPDERLDPALAALFGT